MNSIGRLFRLTTFGESHGVAIGGVIDGMPAGIDIDSAAIQKALDRRRPGQSKQTSQRRESDLFECLSGLYEGRTTGAPIGFLIRNEDQRPSDYDVLKDVYRPGHADFTYQQKYGHRDHRGGGRSSARETATRVVAGAFAAQFLSRYGISVHAGLVQMGDMHIQGRVWADVDRSPFFCPDLTAVPTLTQMIDDLRRERDSIGGVVEVVVHGLPAGLGEPVYGKLSTALTAGWMSINAVKGVEIGDGFSSAAQRGSVHRDVMTPSGFESNHAGGILGGISTGQEVFGRVAFKPPSSIPQPVQSLNFSGEAQSVTVTGRHDPCVAIRGVPVVEAMTWLALMDAWAIRFGQVTAPECYSQ